MSVGKAFLSSVVKSGNKNYLNRVKDELFIDSEKNYLQFFREHVLQYRTLPSKGIIESQGFDFFDTDQPPEFYIEELKKRAVYNMYKKFDAAMKPLLTQKFDAEKAVDLITEFTNNVSRMSVADKYKSLTELGKEIQVQIENRKNGNPEIFVPFPWPTIQRQTGGITGGDLVYIVARPGVGKSQLLSYCAYHAWKAGFKPLVLTMEMTDVQLARRIFGIAGAFNHDAIRREVPDSEVEDRLAKAIEDVENSEVGFDVICGQVRQTVENVATLIDELKPDVVYIDAAYLLNLKNSNAKAWEKIALVGERLKEIAISRGIPIIMTVQFNREAAKQKRFSMDTIAGADAIAQLGSVIIAVQPGPETFEDVRRILEIIKNREGGVCEIEINYVFDPPNFDEIEYVQELDDLRI